MATELNSFMHPGATFEARSKPVPGGHGHQATYDARGELITSTIAAGTADYVSPEKNAIKHRNEDVWPYINALHLDGNPGLPDNGFGILTEMVPLNISHPCIYQGTFLNQYLQLRPTLSHGAL